MAGKGYDKFSQTFTTLAIDLSVIMLAKCFGDGKAGAVFTLDCLIETIKDYMLERWSGLPK